MQEPENRCYYCGALLTPDSRFCKKCGQPVLTPPAYSPSGIPVPRPAANIPAQPGNRSGTNKWLIGGLVGGGLLAVLVCVVAVAGIAIFRTMRSPSIPTQAANIPASTQAAALLASPTVEIEATAVAQDVVTPSLLPPEPTPSDTPIPEQKLSTYNVKGVTFAYDPVLGAGVETETVQAQTSPDLPPWELVPQYTRLTFSGYPLSETFHQPQIFIYPVQDFYTANPSFGDQHATLQQLLMQKRLDNLPNPMPFVPLWNAGQMMAAQVKFLEFQNGSGVRYLTQYGQGIYPINNQAMFYTFQGLTGDGKWLISAVLPVANPVLPDAETVLADPRFTDDYPGYLEEVKKTLSEQPDSSFQPGLSILDAVFQSFKVQ